MKVNFRSQIIKYLFFSSQAPATYNGLVKIRYLDMVINETLRLYPVGVRISRLSKKDAEINGVLTPQNTKVDVALFVLH
jgi:cytochrome P450